MVLEKEEDDAPIIDFIRYKIERHIKMLSPDSVEREMNEAVLKLYDDGIITVQWTEDDMWIAMADGSNISPELLGFPSDGDAELEVVYQDHKEIEFIPDFLLEKDPPSETDD